MDIHLSHRLVSGHLSNEIPNVITGLLYLAGVRQPLHLQLQGNFLRDIAGCRIEVVNPNPLTDSDLDLTTLQQGFAGEMTASRRLRQLQKRHQTVGGQQTSTHITSLKNVLYLEWFNQHQRIHIVSDSFIYNVGPPQWLLSREEELNQLRDIRLRRKQFFLNGNN